MDNPFNISFTPTANPVDKERAAYGDFNKGFTDFLGSQDTVPQLQDKYANKYNVPDLQQKAQFQNEQAQQVGDSIAGVATNFGNDSANSTLTQGQRDRAIQSRTQPLLNSFNALTANANQTNAALGTAQTNQNAAVTAEQAQQMKMTQPWLQAYDEGNILNAAEQTGWSQANSMELQRLITNAQNGITLSEGEKNRANALNVAEKNFQNQLELNKQQASLKTTTPNYESVGEGSALIDPVTGKLIYKNPKTYAPSASTWA